MKNKLNDVKAFVLDWNKENTKAFYDVSDQLWNNPELSMQEYESAAALIKLLKDNGFEVEEGVADMPTAFIATYGNSKPVIGINAEYDALPGLSQRPDCLCKEPVIAGAPGQGCGHNLLGTAGVKAAIAARYAMEKYDLPGTIKVLGSPAEELCIGKAYMGKAGCYEGFDAFLDWHPHYETIANYDGCQSYFSMKFHFKGRTSHGNSPWHGRSALDAAMLQGHAVEMMREHMYPGNPPNAANTINYTFTTCGPEFASVVPDYTTAWYIGRFTTTEEMLAAVDRVTKCAEAGALATETTVEREIIAMTHHKIPNKVLATRMHENLATFGAPAFTEEEQAKAKEIQRNIGVPEVGLQGELLPFDSGWTGLCDTSEFSWNAPYTAPWICMAPQGIGWHNWGITKCAGDTMGQKALDSAAGAISMTCMDIICDPEMLAEATAEWKERMGDRKYECLLEKDMTPPVHLNKDIMEKYRK